jgi:hypothetical protein
MKRVTFLTAAALIAMAVGAFALLFPAVLLASKGVVPIDATNLWMRETGMLLMALGCINWLLRKHDDSSIMKAFLLANVLVQLALFMIEAVGYANGVITQLSGIAPNLTLHVLLASGFVYFMLKIPENG